MTYVIDSLTAWTPAERQIPAEHAAELARAGVVSVSLASPPDVWRLEPDSRVGVVVGNGWELRINPRLKIPKLFFLLGYAYRRKGWNELAVSFEEADDVISAFASGFALHAERALHQGVLRGYVTVEERRYNLRGRVRFAEQLNASFGQPLPLEVVYDDYAVDILENRLIKTAAEVLLRVPRIPLRARTRLMGVRALLEDVGPLDFGSRGDVKAPAITRLNERYADALGLAELILRARSLALAAGSVSSASFLFDMNQVFESFVTIALGDAMRPHGGWLRAQYESALDLAGDLPLKPDITWWRRGTCAAVVDAKYKSLVDRRAMPNADAYQMLAYCIALGIQKGFLVYAKDAGARVNDHEIRRHGYVISVRAVDVESEPAELLRQIDGLADEIASTPVSAAA